MTDQKGDCAIGHWSDCGLHRGPAFMPSKVCSCGGLDLAAYVHYVSVTGLIPCPRSLADFIKNGIAPSAIQSEQTPI